MSIFASILRSVYKLSGAKKAFALPEDALRKEIEKQNRHRGVFTPTDSKAYYETIAANGFPCLIVREHPKPSERAILYFFGGGMVIGPDKGDLPVMRKLCRETGCDVWFPFYPLCMEHCITETYAMVYECYRKMIGLYGGGNVSTCGFSSGGALALGIAAHNNAQPEPLPQPRHIVVVSPGEVPWNDAEKARMQALNERDVSIDYAFMVTVEKFMLNGAITLGTLDGANVEIADAAGHENEIIFGMLTPEVNALKGMGYHPNAFINGDNTAMAVLDFLEKGWNGENFNEVTSNLRNSDPYMVMADFKDYRRAQHDLQELYRDKQKWNHMSLKNISNAGIFSADRSIMDYARDIWGATPVK